MLVSVNDAIELLEKSIPNPEKGLSDEVFYYISRTTPLVSVDLLIQDEDLGTLLSWRDDQYTGQGWHVPGGIIRYKESIISRINQVSKSELATEVVFEPVPIAINQIIAYQQRDRAHFVSLLFKCRVPDDFEINNRVLDESDPGYLRWFQQCPDDILSWHQIYRPFIDSCYAENP